MGDSFPDDWRLLPLEDCMTTIIDYRGKSPEKSSFGVPLITAKIVKGGRIERPAEFILPEHYDSWMRRGIPQAGDVVITTEAPLGEVAQLDGQMVALAQRLITLRGKPDRLDNTYLKYLMQSTFIQQQLHGRSTGTTVHGIRQSELRRVILAIPPLPEQRAIAHILGTLDDKIELNRRMNETLEAMARAIFKSWFVDFDPVRRNMARLASPPSPPSPLPGGEVENYRGGFMFAGLVEQARELRKKQTPAEAIMWELLRDRRLMGLKFRRQHQIGNYIVDFYCHDHCLVIEIDCPVHQSVDQRCRDKKKDEYLQSMGFTVKRFLNEQVLDDPETVLKEIAACCSPLPLGEEIGEGGIYAIDALFPDSFEDSSLGKIPKGWKVAPIGDICEFAYGKALKEDIRQPGLVPVYGSNGQVGWHNEALVKGPGIIVGRKGNPGVVTWSPTEFYPIDTTFYVVPKGDIHSMHYLFHVLQLQDLGSLGADSAVPGLNRNLAYMNEIIIPHERILVAFDVRLSALDKAIHINIEQLRTLAAIRDALLPRLLSGKIHVKDVERFMEKIL
jgi:very-short-patch-repair endonuclease/restriction endonuclease S subunit